MDGKARIHLGPNILYLYDLNDMSNTGNPTQHQVQVQGGVTLRWGWECRNAAKGTPPSHRCTESSKNENTKVRARKKGESVSSQ